MFVIEVPYLDLDQVYDSGQIFRWEKLREHKYIIVNGDKVAKVEQVRERFMIACTEEDFYNVWYDYFDLEGAYDDICYRAGKIGNDDFMKICSVRGKGVRILKQDLFEMIITFALATATNIPRIRQMVKALCEVCGVRHEQSFQEVGRHVWYEFPTPESIIDNENELKKCKMGFRENYIVQIAKDVHDGWLNLEELKQMSYPEAKEYLMQFDGIGPKVADCICLYGLHHMEAFPVDTHIEEILKRQFGFTYEEFADWYAEEIDGIQGMVQQYMFYNELNPPRRMITYGFDR